MHIKRQFFRDIVAKRKRVEYREIKPYWTNRLQGVRVPFFLRLINGMQPNAPEVTLVVESLRRRSGSYELHLGRIKDVKNWDRRREEPTD